MHKRRRETTGVGSVETTPNKRTRHQRDCANSQNAPGRTQTVAETRRNYAPHHEDSGIGLSPPPNSSQVASRRSLRLNTRAIMHSPEPMVTGSPTEMSPVEDDSSHDSLPHSQDITNAQEKPRGVVLAETPQRGQYRPPRRPLPANPRRQSTPAPGCVSKPPLGDRLRLAADRHIHQTFTYESLPADHVRLLKLEHGMPADPIHVNLMNVPFESLGGDYSFEALSYNWGDDDAEDPIMQNLKEKEVQVGRIADIYVAAENVLIWLGESNSRTKRAINLLHELADVQKQAEIIENRHRLQQWLDLVHLMKASWFSRRWVIQELALAKNAVVYCGGEAIHWNDLRDGFGLFVNYEDHIRKQFHGSPDYNHDYHALEDPEPLAAKMLIEQVGDVFRKNSRSGEFTATQGLETLVSSLFAFQTSDPRDTINALINVSKEGVGMASRFKATVEARSESMRQSTMILDAVDRSVYNNHIAPRNFAGIKPPPLPSYRKDLLDVYLDIIRWIVETTGSINILCRHWAIPERVRQISGYPELVNLPSWIKLTTDGPFRQDGSSWARQNGDGLVGMPDRSPYTACGRLNKAKIKFETHNATHLASSAPVPMDLRKYATAKVKGLHVGTVDACTDPVCGGNITMHALEMLGWSARDTDLSDNIWLPLVAERGPQGNNPPDIWRRSCIDILANYTVNGSINIDMILPKIKLQHTKDFLKRMRQVTWNRRFLEVDLETVFKDAICNNSPHLTSGCTNNHNSIGLGPAHTQPGDVVCILSGCSVPCVLRPKRSPEGVSGLWYEFIGETYMYGFMDGEGITMLDNKERSRGETEFTMR